MWVDVATDAYGRFMGRFSEPLAAEFAATLELEPGMRALDVGAGPGALTARLVQRLGPDLVTAAEPSPPFVESLRRRFPAVRVETAPAEALPFSDDSFDVAAAQLVVHFMTDPVGGLREMRRVTRPGGLVAACVWDGEEGGSPLTPFYRAAKQVDPRAPIAEENMPGTRRGQLGEYAAAAGLRDPVEGTVAVEVEMPSIEEYWDPFLLGVGPGGQYLLQLPPGQQEEVRGACAAHLGDPPYLITARAWTVHAQA